ncbi:hypothetical protein [Yinghuangia soli]|uniref:Uncharacterized protein n=1 Tax=Yinghuangia soli TaxID=2908204 RepID=A0AA41TZI0_9ACTN|nr:hypothetical protein [Yinghuangia soli]MCF2528838.1 hypothetical protein [Yinghuangia soli]
MTEARPGFPASAEPDLLRQFWWLHDARWYQAVKNRFGQDVANELNAEVMQFVARRVATVFARRFPVGRDAAPQEVAEALEALARLMFAGTVRLASTEFAADGSWETEVSEHYALKMLKASRSLENYQCPCLELRGGWFEGLRVTAADEVVACMREGAEVCRFRACLKPGQDPPADDE